MPSSSSSSLPPQPVVDHIRSGSDDIAETTLSSAMMSSMWIPLRPDGTEILQVIPHGNHTSTMTATTTAQVLFSNNNLRSMVDPTNNTTIATSSTIGTRSHIQDDGTGEDQKHPVETKVELSIPSTSSDDSNIPHSGEPIPPQLPNDSLLRLQQQEQELLQQEHHRMIRIMEETGYFTEIYNHNGGDDSFSSSHHSAHNDIDSNNIIKVLYPLHNRSRQSIVLDSTRHGTQPNSVHRNIVLVIKLYDPPYTVLALCINGRIQYMIPDPTLVLPSQAPFMNAKSNALSSIHQHHPNDHIMNISSRSVVYEMMTHIPMCAVQIEPSYILIVNSLPSSMKGNTFNRKRYNNRMVGYGIIQQLLQYYTSTIYKIILVEEDPVLFEIYTQYFNPEIRDDNRITVVHTNPFLGIDGNDNDDVNGSSSNQCYVSNRYHVIYVVEDDPVVLEENDTTTLLLRDQYRTNIYRALVPNGGVACFLTCPTNVQTMQDSIIPMKYEYATMPTISWNDHYRNPSDMMILQLCVRLYRNNNHQKENTKATYNRTTIMNQESTCRIPIRRPLPVGTTSSPLNWYSSGTHVAAFTIPPMIQRQLFPLFVDDINAPSSITVPIFAPTPVSSGNATRPPNNAIQHPMKVTNEGLSHNDNDTSEEKENTTTCRPNVPLGCMGDNIHRWIQRHIAKVTTKFVSIPS